MDGAKNVGAKALRRLRGAHKPIVRLMHRRERAREQAAFALEAARVRREIAAVAAGTAPIIAGPWLSEVGYEALYWVPFLRWFQRAHRVPPERLTVVSRGGVEWWYRGIAAHYADIFDHLTPDALAAGNQQRQIHEEGGGRKQLASGAFDEQILAMVRRRAGLADATILHPSLLFRLFRNVWLEHLPLDVLWAHTEYALIDRPPRPAIAGLPDDYVAVKLYAGTALPDTAAQRETLRAVVRRIAASAPVVALDTGLSVDDHHDYVVGGIPNVISARPWMSARDNLGLQTALIAGSRMFLGTCGGLAWLAPFLGVPAVGVYADDKQLAPHLLTARQAGRRAGAAEFSLLDLRALSRLGLGTEDRSD